MTLAYVFWHTPTPPERPGDPLADHYEAAMQAFHTALGRPGTATFRLERAPFGAHGPAYEDWYPVEDWAALGELNDFAISGARKPPHDAVAALSRTGAGAVYRLLTPGPPLEATTFAAWTDERPDPPPGAAVWQRQLVLGPAPEYAVLAGSPVDGLAGAALTIPRFVAGA